MNEETGGGASQTTEPAAGSSTGTDVDLRAYLAVVVEALDRRTAELRAADSRFQEERDRRYSEVAVEREKALAIKEKADEAARILVAENQKYRDEKGNELREQINRERLLYATKDDMKFITEKIETSIKPLAEYVTSQQGGPRAITTGNLYAALFVGVAVVGVIVALANYFASH
jgi:hypothetical protein